jgi:hypothetical protein
MTRGSMTATWGRVAAAGIVLCLGFAALLGATKAAAAPLNATAPSIGGTALDGKRLKAARGSWEGAKPLAYSYQWGRCDGSGGSCTDIPAGKNPSYKLTDQDVGHALRVTVTVTDAGAAAASATSAPSAVVQPSALSKRKRPSITGSSKDGQLLTVGTGTWKGTQPQSYAYQWQACSKSGACSDIEGATGASYRVATAQIGKKLRAIVTATNAAGEASTASKASKPATAGPPVSVTQPAVKGSLQEGQTLSADPGDWAGTGPIAYAYQWLRCSVAGGGCQQIPGAEGSTYTAEGADLASNLAVVVTASNAQGTVSATSPETQPILGILPTSSVLPSISGTLQDGQLLSVATGLWSGTQPIAYSFQWELCNALGQACAPIEGATGSALPLDPSEIGKTLAVLVTATNSAGSSSATTPVTGPIAGILPSNTTLPNVSGLLQDGGLLSASAGEWSGSAPISYAYQWQLCNALGQSCKDIEGASGQSLSLSSLDVGSTLRMVVTATNAAGSQSAASAATSPIAALLPSNVSPPTISGLLQTGQLLSVTNGAWSGTAPIAYSYQWQLCNALGGGCTNISKATEPGFKLSLADVGLTLRAIVTATNGGGSVSQASAVTGLIAGLL